MGRFSLKRAPFGLSPSLVDFSVSGETSSSEIQTVFFFWCQVGDFGRGKKLLQKPMVYTINHRVRLLSLGLSLFHTQKK